MTTISEKETPTMRITVNLCDLCLANGDATLAEAVYWNKDGEEFDCCKTHLEDVQNQRLDYERYPTEGNADW